MAETFNERIERFIHTHYDHVARRELPDGSSVIVFNEFGCFDKMDDPCELFPVAGLHVIRDYTDEFCKEIVYFIVDESECPLDSVELVSENDYWAIYEKQAKMERLFNEVYVA